MDDFWSFFETALEVTDAFVEGYNAASDGKRSRAKRGRRRDPRLIERLCARIGWSVDECDGDTVVLHFNHAELGRRSVRIYGCDDTLFFVVVSHAFPKPDWVPNEVMGYLLGRTGQTSVGAWSADVDKDGDAVFCLSYRALGDPLDASTFQWICTAMVAEVCQFDAKMRAAGLL